MGIRIVATGSYVPPHAVTNDDLSGIVDTSDEWIRTRTGIAERRFAPDTMSGADMACAAAAQAIARARTADQGMREGTGASAAGASAAEAAPARAGAPDCAPADIPLADVAGASFSAIIAATFTPDELIPSLACTVRERLGLAPDTLAFDLNGACCGFVYALRVAEGLLELDPGARVLVVASERISGVLDFADRTTCVLFGDGAAACVVERSEAPTWFHAESTDGSRLLASATNPWPKRVPGIRMRGQEVFRFACEALERTARDLLARSGLAMGDVSQVLCHQANERIIAHVEKRLGAAPGTFPRNIGKYGNTSAASIPLLLDELAGAGRLQRGEKVMLIAFGAGLTVGGMVFEW